MEMTTHPTPALPADVATEQQIARAIRDAIESIPANNPGYISVRQETLGNVVSEAMLWRISKTAAATALTTQSAALAAARAENSKLRESLTELVRAVETTVNEKGGGGFILARLNDARAALAEGG